MKTEDYLRFVNGLICSNIVYNIKQLDSHNFEYPEEWSQEQYDNQWPKDEKGEKGESFDQSNDPQKFKYIFYLKNVYNFVNSEGYYSNGLTISKIGDLLFGLTIENYTNIESIEINYNYICISEIKRDYILQNNGNIIFRTPIPTSLLLFGNTVLKIKSSNNHNHNQNINVIFKFYRIHNELRQNLTNKPILLKLDFDDTHYWYFKDGSAYPIQIIK
jgi:hypothetical protein